MTVVPVDPATPEEWSTVRVSGADAEGYLQGQLSQDVARLADGGTWCGLLQPDSTVVAALYGVRGGSHIDLVGPTVLAEAVVARLRRFVLRADVRFEVAAGADGPFDTVGERVAAGWPGPAEYALGLTPHCFGRSFVDATISFTKGCFTGQELVGRLDARGSSVPWRFVRVRGTSLEVLDATLRGTGPDGPQGVTTAVEVGGVVDGLGVAHRTLVAAPPADGSIAAID